MTWGRVAAACLLSVLAPTLAVAQNLILWTPGTYVLAADSTSTGLYNIYIVANDVTLDLNGKTVRCSPSSPSTDVTFGVTTSDRQRVTIKNGKITGCMFGVHAGYSSGVTLENVDFTGNTYVGANLGGGGSGNIVRHCTFAKLAGYTAQAYAIGINGIGHHGVIEDNQFLDLYRQVNTSDSGEGLGVLVDGNANGVVVRRNTFHNATYAVSTIGIWMATGAQATVTDNAFTNFRIGLASMGTVTVSANKFTLTTPTSDTWAITASAGHASGNTFTGYAHILDGTITDGGGNTVVDPPPPPPPPSGGRWFRICVDSATQCYEGVLLRAPGSGGV